MALGHYEDAANPLEQSVGMLDSNPSADPRNAAAAWQCLGTTSYRLRRYSSAEQAYRKVLELRPGAVDVLSDLGAVYVDEGQLAKAEVTLQEAFASAERDSGVDPVVTASLLGNLGGLYRSSGRRTQGEQALRRGLTTLERNPDLTGVVRVHLLCNLGSVLFDRGDYAEATGLVREAAEAIGKSPMIPPRDAAAVFEDYAACLRKMRQKRAAAQQEARARLILSGLPAEESVDVSRLRKR